MPPILFEVVGLLEGVEAGAFDVEAEPEIVFFGLGDGFGVVPVAESTSNSQTSS